MQKISIRLLGSSLIVGPNQGRTQVLYGDDLSPEILAVAHVTND